MNCETSISPEMFASLATAEAVLSTEVPDDTVIGAWIECAECVLNEHPTCRWTYDETHVAWDTACQHKFQFDAGGPGPWVAQPRNCPTQQVRFLFASLAGLLGRRNGCSPSLVAAGIFEV